MPIDPLLDLQAKVAALEIAVAVLMRVQGPDAVQYGTGDDAIEIHITRPEGDGEPDQELRETIMERARVHYRNLMEAGGWPSP